MVAEKLLVAIQNGLILFSIHFFVLSFGQISSYLYIFGNFDTL